MPANLTPMYRKAEETFRAAKTTEEKLAALHEMYATIPKHKGTEKMQGDIRRRMAKLRSDAEEARGRGGSVDPFHVEKHGAGQFVLIGTPNVGKSALVGVLTKARVHVAPYPFATHAPVPGMMPFEDIQIEVVDMPPVTQEALPSGMMGAVRNADGLLVCVDLSAKDILEQVEVCLGVLAARGLVPQGQQPPEGGMTKRMLLAGTKVDVPGAADNFEILKELHKGLMPMVATSAETGRGLEDLARLCFESLGVIRVYSKKPGQKPNMERPFVLPAGSTVLRLAEAVHRDLAGQLKFARIWGTGVYDGQPVQREHVLSDRDIIELHE